MTVYNNLSGDSGVDAYAIGIDSITVRFKKGGSYLYNGEKPGPHHVELMKELAIQGHGLNSYISRHIRGNYAAKL